MHRYLFIGGLHRSGTSILARLIAAHPQISAIEGAPVPENEGCYLQGAIPHTALDGAPMRFATDPRQHLVEGCRHDTHVVRDRMEADWAPWFETSKPWRLEKSPVNLTRMRLYQQLFPLSQFVVILRHPEVVAQAVAKWLPEDAPEALVDHWLQAHAQLESDLPYLHSVCVIHYEDLCANPAGVIAGLHGFMGLAAQPVAAQVRDSNAEYAAVPLLPENAAARWGYGPAHDVRPWMPHVTHTLRACREAALDRMGFR